MGDENPIRTLGDYSKPSHEGYRNTIELPILYLKHGLVSRTYSKKSLIMASTFGSKSKSFMTMSIPSQDEPLTNRPVTSLDRTYSRTDEAGRWKQPLKTPIELSQTGSNHTDARMTRLVPRSSNTKFVCSKEDDGEVMFIEIIRDDEPQNEREVAPTEEPIVEYVDTFPTREEMTYHKYLMSGPIPSIFLRNPIIITGRSPIPSPVVQIVAKLYVTTDKVRDIETSAHIDVHDDDYVINDATVVLYRENAKKNLDVFDLFNNISTSEIEAATREKPDIDINNEAFEDCNDCLFLNFSNKPNGGSDHITIRGKDGSLAMFYLALKNAVDADLKVEFLVPSMETKVYGSVVAYFGKNFEYSDYDDLYYLILFKKKRSAFVGPGCLHLMRSALAVPANSSLLIKANLFDNTSENEILSGTCEITVGLDGKPTVGSIVSKDYFLSVLVNWKLPSEELKIPSSPICHPALASNSIVSRLTKRIKFGAHSTSSMAGHSTFSMTDPDERNRWSLQEELENVFNASLKRVFNLQEVVSWSISTCTKEDGGDYLCSGVMHIWPELRKARSYRGPKCAGLALKNIMESEYNDMMESCVVCGPGFVKFKLSRKWIAEGIHRILTAGIDTWAPKLTVKKTVIYCLSQNGGEEMHMGHLRSTIIGETLARVLHHCGVVVILKRIIDKDLPNLNYLDIKGKNLDVDRMKQMHNNYLDDYFESLDKERMDREEGKARPLEATEQPEVHNFHGFVTFLLLEFGALAETLGLTRSDGEKIRKCYETYLEVFIDEKVAPEAVGKGNEKLEHFGIKLEEEEACKPQQTAHYGKEESQIKCYKCQDLRHYAFECPLKNKRKYQNKLKMMMEFLIERKGQAIGELEVLYNESKKMFDEDAGFRDRANVSLGPNSQNDMESNLNVHLILYEFNSIHFQDKSSYTTTMRDTIELMMVTEGDKAVTKGPNSPLVDLRALQHALVEEKADWVVHVTDEGKRVSIEMCIIATRHAKLILKDPSKCPLSHVGFGLVQGDDFKHPKAVDFVNMLDKAKSHCKGLLARTGMADAWTAVEIEHAAEALGIGALKYADLKNNRLTNYTFSFDQMLNEEGDTAVYLQFTHARICSFIKKLKAEELQESTLKNDNERELGLHLLGFSLETSAGQDVMSSEETSNLLLCEATEVESESRPEAAIWSLIMAAC
ncbi:anticodon-binding aminoacyl-tRNA synthetase, class 1a [Tanacetum coccineum]